MDNLKTFIGKETLIIILQLIILSFGIFWMMYGGPVDPIANKFPKASPEIREELREELGYNRPLIVQYADYMIGLEHRGGLLRGDMGESIKYTETAYKDKTLWDLYKPRIWISCQLGLTFIIIGFPLGIILGLIAAKFRNSWFDSFLISTLMSFSVFPSMVMILLCIFIFNTQLHWLPPGGWDGIFSANAIIPIIALILPSLAGGARFTRMNVLHVIEEDYVRMAYAKGLPEKQIFLKHVLPNAAPPILYILIVSLGDTLLTGFLFIELIYGIRGIGKFMLDAAYALDYDVILSFSIMVTSIYLIMRRVADIALGILDPRIRAGAAKQF